MSLDYGVIGNSTTAALVSEKGSVDWLCFPDFSSPSIFAALLDKEKGGRFAFEVSGDYVTTQDYVPHTNLLKTIFSSPEGVFALFDFMPCYHQDFDGSTYRPAEVYRYIRWISGCPKLKVIFDPRPNYAKGKTIHHVSDKHIRSYSSSNTSRSIYLYSSVSFDDILEGNEIGIHSDQFFLLTSNEKIVTVDLDREYLDYCKTLSYWLDWTSHAKKYTAYNNVIERSMLVLKMMTYSNGAVLAAITTSLPEIMGGVRNWDYRFCWLRDASMTIETLINLGHRHDARRFVNFFKSTFAARHGDFQIMYGIHGERKLTEKELSHLSGYADSKPVRIGNDAYHQKQNDSFGYLMSMIYQYFLFVPDELDDLEDMWDMVKNIVSRVIRVWRLPDKGIWEIRGKEHQFVSSKVMCWVAIDRGVRIARLLNMDTLAERWLAEAEEVKKDVFLNGWNDEMQSFVQAYDNNYLDASLLLMEPYGFISAEDKRYKSTVKAVRKALFRNGLMYRYNTPDDFGLPKTAFTMCTFWLVRALFVTGEQKEARGIFDATLGYSSHLGLFSEDIDFETKELLGNFPQAYSHLAIVNTAILLSEERQSLNIKRK